MYTSVTVMPYLNASDAMFSTGKPEVNVANATAEVVIGQEYVLVYTKSGAGAKVSKDPTPGEPYRITGSSGLNVVGVYLGQPDGNPQPMRFKIGN